MQTVPVAHFTQGLASENNIYASLTNISSGYMTPQKLNFFLGLQLTFKAFANVG